MRRIVGRVPIVVSAMLLGAAVAFPLGVVASHQFTDVPNTNPFHADIDALVDAGVTSGCAAGKYCPKDFVTREQMAAFLNRLGALQAGTTPVVNATRLDGLDSTRFLKVGDIEVMQHGPWMPLSGGVTIGHNLDSTRITRGTDGAASVRLALDAPGAVGGMAYGLESVEVCFAPSSVTIDLTRVSQSITTGFSSVITDTTNRPMGSGGCYTITDPSPQAPVGGSSLLLILAYPGAATALIGNVTTSWTSVG